MNHWHWRAISCFSEEPFVISAFSVLEELHAETYKKGTHEFD